MSKGAAVLLDRSLRLCEPDCALEHRWEKAGRESRDPAPEVVDPDVDLGRHRLDALAHPAQQ